MTIAYITVLSGWLLFIVISGFIPQTNSGASCNEDSWHYLSLTIVDSVQTVLLITMTTIIFCRSKAPKDETTKSVESLSLSSMESDKRFLTQMILLTIFYLCATFFDWLQHIESKINLHNMNIICVDNMFIVV